MEGEKQALWGGGALTHIHENMFTHTHTQRHICIYTPYMCIHMYIHTICEIFKLFNKNASSATNRPFLPKQRAHGHTSSTICHVFLGIFLSKHLKNSISPGKEHTPCHQKCLAFIQTLLPKDLYGPHPLLPCFLSLTRL